MVTPSTGSHLLYGWFFAHALGQFSDGSGMWHDSDGIYFCDGGPCRIGQPHSIHAVERMRATTALVVDRKEADAA